MLGQSIAHYTITEKLGEGGMGVVYKARDTRLARDVAIKVLPDALAADSSFLARFQREARTLAALNHPNIATIHGLEKHEGIHALVMELVEGPTLEQRLSSGPIPPHEAVPIARQIAEALEAAHDRGIIHRDLKPANIKITPDGQVKVLDFGLAKALDETAPSGNPVSSPTLVAGRSLPGMILGTAAYMSPEQARGAHLDKRTDIWSFGVVLYEMLTGKMLFAGETISDTLASVLKTDIDWSALPGSTPSHVRRMLTRCLERDRKKRLRDISTFFEAADEPEAPVKPQATHGFSWLPWVLFAATATAAIALLLFPRKTLSVPVRRFSIPADPLSSGPSLRSIAISPDGRHLAYVDGRKLWVRSMDREEAKAIDNSEGAGGLFWSPDSAFIGFEAAGELKKVSLQGDKPVRLCRTTNYRGGAWSPDGGSIVYSQAGSAVFEVSSSGGEPRRLKTNFSQTLYAPHFLPGTKRILVAGNGSFGFQQLVLLNLDTGQLQTLRPGHFPTYAAGQLVFQASELWAAPLSPDSPNPLGEPVMISSAGGQPSVASDGTLVFGDYFHASFELVMRSRSGERLSVAGQPQVDIRNVRFSPDGARIAVYSFDQGKADIWIHEVSRPLKNRLTFGGGISFGVAWNPSGKDIGFGTRDGEKTGIAIVSAAGGGSARTLSLGNASIQDWSLDGQSLLVSRSGGSSNTDLWVVPLNPDGRFGEPKVFLQTPFNEINARISPDGRFVAYESDETGRTEVYVRPFPKGESKWQVSAGGGARPAWNRNGRELFFVAEGRTLVAATVSFASGFSTDAPRPLFPLEVPLTGLGMPYDVHPDGKRFLVSQPVPDPNPKPAAIHIIQNWTEAFLRK